jgi:hypothetical protein
MFTCPPTEARFAQILGEVRSRGTADSARPHRRVDRAGVYRTQWSLDRSETTLTVS